MHISQIDGRDIDLATAAEVTDVRNLAAADEAPHLDPVSAEHTLLRFKHGWDEISVEQMFLARSDDGTLIGSLEYHVSVWDNTSMVAFVLHALPTHRGEGVDNALVAAATSLAVASGKELVITDGWVDRPSADYWKSHGFQVASIAAQRRLTMAELDWEKLDRLAESSTQTSPGYEVVELDVSAPNELIPGLIELHLAMNDAPLDDLELEADVWNEKRLRAYETAMAHRNIRLVRLLARRRSDGVLGGHTVLALEDGRPWIGFQEDTAVVRGHRGYRLGLRLKTAMLRLVRDREPLVERIDTWNAESNSHMIAVNDALGCVVVGRGIEFQKHLD